VYLLTYWKQEKCIQGFGQVGDGGGGLRERDPLEDVVIDGGNIKMHLREMGWGGMDWITVSQDRDRWWSVTKAILNPQVP